MIVKLLYKNEEQAKTENVKTDNISEIETNIFCNPLMEMARVDVPEQDSKLLGTKEIWVYANDRNPMSPHFHYFDKKNKPIFYIEIKISDMTICFSQPREGVAKNKLLTWEGIEDAKHALEKWLDEKPSDLSTTTNRDFLKAIWNRLNPDNKII